MQKIHFIFLRSIIGDNTEFKDKERHNFLEEFNKNNDFIFDDSGEDFFFIETGGTEEQFKKIYKQFKEPFLLVATDANNSLPAALEIATFLKNNGKKFKLFHGKPEEVRNKIKFDEIGKISENCGSFSKKSILEGQRFGVIGKPSDWLIASDVNYKEAKEKIGAELVDISSEEFLRIISKISVNKIPENFKKLLSEKVDEKTLVGALNIYHAISELISKYNLNGITVRCFDLLDTVKNTSCLALALLNKEGYIATCEGDIPTMLTMAIIRKLTNQSSFQVNPSYINVDDRYGYFAHCTLPLDMCESFEFDTHFESDIGLGVKGKLNLSEVTIFKINRNLSNFEIFEGKIIENLSKHNLCRTQVKVEFKENISLMINSPNGNHLVIFYGHHKQEFVKYLSK